MLANNFIKLFIVAFIIMYVVNIVTAFGAEITLNSTKKYQTILGWGASTGYPTWMKKKTLNEVIDMAVNELGINRLRIEPPGGNRSHTIAWEWLNDNNKPFEINWDAYNRNRLRVKANDILLPFKEKVEANGEILDTYVSTSFFDGGSTGAAPEWLLYSPGEYAEYAMSLLHFLRDSAGIEPTYYSILNEAGNNNRFTAGVVAEMIKVLGPEMEKAGFETKIQFPECINAKISWNYVNATKNDIEMWGYVGCVSYHLYGGNNPFRENLRDFAKPLGLPTAQTEFMNLTMQHLYDDLTKGGVSYWEVYGLGLVLDWNFNRYSRKAQYWNFRQVFHYVRPGAVRIEAISDNSGIMSLAFERDSRTIVVLINSGAGKDVTINNLTNGDYGICNSFTSKPYNELGIISAENDKLFLKVAANSVTTIYPYPGSNQPPVFTNWGANVEYLTLPDESVNLSAFAEDPEKDDLSYSWMIMEQPTGAEVNIIDPVSTNTAVSGLSISGEYVFEVTVDDGSKSDSREVRISVFDKNQPPIPLDVHSRLPVWITLPVNYTELRAGAWDLEGDNLSYEWTLIDSPVGSNPNLTSPMNKRSAVKNLDIPGDYLFEFKVMDGINTARDTLLVPVYPINNNAPGIIVINADQDTIQLPKDSVNLYANTEDTDGDKFTHWWSVKSAPSGAKPYLIDRGDPHLKVRNMSLPGDYIFTLIVIDRTKRSSKDIRVVVVEASSVESDDDHIDLLNYSNPYSESHGINYQIIKPGHVILKLFDMKGNEISVLVDGFKETGEYNVHIASDLSQGVYFLELISGGDVKENGKIIIIE